MRRYCLAAVLCSAVFLFTGCVFAPVSPPRGILFTNQTAPLVTMGTKGSKEGRVSSHNILFLVGWGDSGLDAAMEKGDITRVTNADYQVINYFLFYQRYTTIARGE